VDDGVNIWRLEARDGIYYSMAALVVGFGGMASLFAPEPVVTKVFAVGAFIDYEDELSQEWNAANNFGRSIDAASRLDLDQSQSRFMP